MQKFNPLFLEEYNSENFFIPNIICIVDDAVRRDIDVCQGAIGWRENRRGTEILFLYDEFVEHSGLKFVPVAVCDEVYYIDFYDKKRFVKLDYVFQQSQEEKLAELEHIAYSLGAKNCSIIIEEKENKREKKNGNLSTVEGRSLMSVGETYEAETSSDSQMRCTSKSETQFKGNDTVSVPSLKWFEYDNNILNLIEYRCKGGNEITSKTLELSGAASATMSRKAACAIDMAIADIGVKQSGSMEDRSVKESTMKILYSLEF